MPSTKALLSSFLAASSIVGTAIAHPGEEHNVNHEIAKRDFQVARQARSLAKCASSLKARQVQAAAELRRLNKFHALRKARGLENTPIKRRDYATDAATSHNETSTGYTSSTSHSDLFGSDTACILTGEVTQGPYWVDGEYVREDVRESQEGVDLHLELQFVDVSTCETVSAKDLYVDIWHCNATGVYGGVVANGNGDSSDESNLDATFLRGVQPTDSDGVVTFDTIVPGHYSGRTNHVHIMAHQNGTVNSNNTYSIDNTISHVGQLFFDQDLLTDVETVSPYSTNTQSHTLNTEDSIAQGEADNNYDPFVKYAYLGDSVADGLLAWISIGVDMSADYTDVSSAATLTSDGGVANSNGFGGGGSGGPGGNGTMSGAPPSGSGAMGSFPSGGMSGGSGAAPSGTAGGVSFRSTATTTSAASSSAAISSVSSGAAVAATSSSAASAGSLSASAQSQSFLALSSSSAAAAPAGSSSPSVASGAVSRGGFSTSCSTASRSGFLTSASVQSAGFGQGQQGQGQAQGQGGRFGFGAGQGQRQGQGQGQGQQQQQQQQQQQKGGIWSWLL